MHGHHEATIWLAGVTLGRELRARALSHTALVRRATAGELGHEVACRQRPHSASGRLHRGHQLLSEERVGSAVCELAHRVGPAHCTKSNHVLANPHTDQDTLIQRLLRAHTY